MVTFLRKFRQHSILELSTHCRLVLRAIILLSSCTIKQWGITGTSKMYHKKKAFNCRGKKWDRLQHMKIKCNCSQSSLSVWSIWPPCFILVSVKLKVSILDQFHFGTVKMPCHIVHINKLTCGILWHTMPLLCHQPHNL